MYAIKTLDPSLQEAAQLMRQHNHFVDIHLDRCQYGAATINAFLSELNADQLLDIETLSLQGNHLSRLPPQLSHMKNLKALNLRYNRLTTYRWQAPKLQKLDLRDNPILRLETPPDRCYVGKNLWIDALSLVIALALDSSVSQHSMQTHSIYVQTSPQNMLGNLLLRLMRAHRINQYSYPSLLHQDVPPAGWASLNSYDDTCDLANEYNWQQSLKSLYLHLCRMSPSERKLLWKHICQLQDHVLNNLSTYKQLELPFNKQVTQLNAALMQRLGKRLEESFRVLNAIDPRTLQHAIQSGARLHDWVELEIHCIEPFSQLELPCPYYQTSDDSTFCYNKQLSFAVAGSQLPAVLRKLCQNPNIVRVSANGYTLDLSTRRGDPLVPVLIEGEPSAVQALSPKIRVAGLPDADFAKYYVPRQALPTLLQTLPNTPKILGLALPKEESVTCGGKLHAYEPQYLRYQTLDPQLALTDLCARFWPSGSKAAKSEACLAAELKQLSLTAKAKPKP